MVLAEQASNENEVKKGNKEICYEYLTCNRRKMTNVKLKLMFYLLNVLLTAHIVQARPYSETNSTDSKINSPYNETFHILVDPNADTLIVTNEYDDHPESEESEHSQMEAIMNAEQGRDTEMSSKYNKKETKPKTKPKTKSKVEPESGNNTNLHMDAIIDAEMDRDVAMLKKTAETDKRVLEAYPQKLDSKATHVEELIRSEMNKEDVITDIHSDMRPEFAEMPRFEFLIATKINESDESRTDIKSAANDNSLLKIDRNSSDVLKKVDYVELVEVLKAFKLGDNKSDYNLANITVHELEDDLAPDTILSVFSGFSDVQTWFLACFATLVPLLGVLCATLIIRSMCRRWCRSKSEDSLSESSAKDDDNQPIKSSPEEAPAAEGGGGGGGQMEGTPSNGSIFTMTLKNNHLIVETEERNDIISNGRETKMKYSPDNEGIFVVEVQQSTGYRPTTKPQNSSPPQDPQISTNQALIHRVAEELDKREDSESSGKFQKDRALALSSTGLSISDLSMSSIGSHNVSYTYGSQLGYEHGPFGYPLYAGYDIKDDSSDGIVHDNSQEPLISKTPTDPDKPVVTAAIFKQDSMIGNDVLQGPVYSIEGSTDGPLLSDVQAREISLQVLHDQKEKKVENGAAVFIPECKIENEKKPLSRADSLPVQFEEPQTPECKPAMETIEENNVDDFIGPSKDAFKGKRASLPIITTEVYESVKDAIRPSGSPKFEKLRNDSSTAVNSFDQPPMITITEEIESKVDSS